MNNELKEKLESINSKYETFKVERDNIRCAAEDCIKGLLGEVEGNRVEYDVENDGCVCVTYDGGRHPEYASDCYCEVESIFLNEKGEVCVEIEECEEYEIDRIWDLGEIMDILSFVEYKCEQMLK